MKISHRLTPRSTSTVICHKLELGPDDHVLEIGCGWGGFTIHAAATAGCRVTGITISGEQLNLAREWMAATGVDHLVGISGSLNRVGFEGLNVTELASAILLFWGAVLASQRQISGSAHSSADAIVTSSI